MRVDLNLASNPAGWNRAFWLAAGGLGMVLLGFAAVLVVTYWQNRDPAPQLTRREVELRGKLAAIQGEDAELQAVLQDPGNAAVLERSLFINQLLFRKGISWTKTFADLEQTLPPRVLMIQIRPQVTADNKVWLDMHVGAETPVDFIELLKALEAAEMFGPAHLRGSAPPSDNQPLFRYQLAVIYEQEFEESNQPEPETTEDR